MTLEGQIQQKVYRVTLQVELDKVILMEQIQEGVDKMILHVVHHHFEVDMAIRTVQILEQVDKVILLGVLEN